MLLITPAFCRRCRASHHPPPSAVAVVLLITPRLLPSLSCFSSPPPSAVAVVLPTQSWLLHSSLVLTCRCDCCPPCWVHLLRCRCDLLGPAHHGKLAPPPSCWTRRAPLPLAAALNQQPSLPQPARLYCKVYTGRHSNTQRNQLFSRHSFQSHIHQESTCRGPESLCRSLEHFDHYHAAHLETITGRLKEFCGCLQTGRTATAIHST